MTLYDSLDSKDPRFQEFLTMAEDPTTGNTIALCTACGDRLLDPCPKVISDCLFRIGDEGLHEAYWLPDGHRTTPNMEPDEDALWHRCASRTPGVPCPFHEPHDQHPWGSPFAADRMCHGKP